MACTRQGLGLRLALAALVLALATCAPRVHASAPCTGAQGADAIACRPFSGIYNNAHWIHLTDVANRCIKNRDHWRDDRGGATALACFYSQLDPTRPIGMLLSIFTLRTRKAYTPGFADQSYFGYNDALNAVFATAALICGKGRLQSDATLKAWIASMPFPMAGLLPGLNSYCNIVCKLAKACKRGAQVDPEASSREVLRDLGVTLEALCTSTCGPDNGWRKTLLEQCSQTSAFWRIVEALRKSNAWRTKYEPEVAWTLNVLLPALFRATQDPLNLVARTTDLSDEAFGDWTYNLGDYAFAPVQPACLSNPNTTKAPGPLTDVCVTADGGKTYFNLCGNTLGVGLWACHVDLQTPHRRALAENGASAPILLDVDGLPVGKELLHLVLDIANPLGRALAMLEPFQEFIRTVGSGLKPVLHVLEQIWKVYHKTLAPVMDQLKVLEEVLKALDNVIASPCPIEVVGEHCRSACAYTKDVTKFFKGLEKDVKQAGKTAVKAVEKASSTVKKYIKKNWDDLPKAIKNELGDWGDDVEDFFDDVGDTIGGWFGRRLLRNGTAVDDEAVSAHGRSLQSKLSLQDVCNAGCDVLDKNPIQQGACEARKLVEKYAPEVIVIVQRAVNKACGGCMDRLVRWLNNLLQRLRVPCKVTRMRNFQAVDCDIFSLGVIDNFLKLPDVVPDLSALVPNEAREAWEEFLAILRALPSIPTSYQLGSPAGADHTSHVEVVTGRDAIHLRCAADTDTIRVRGAVSGDRACYFNATAPIAGLCDGATSHCSVDYDCGSTRQQACWGALLPSAAERKECPQYEDAAGWLSKLGVAAAPGAAELLVVFDCVHPPAPPSPSPVPSPSPPLELAANGTDTTDAPSPSPFEPNTSWMQPPASPAVEPGPAEASPSPSPSPTEPNTSRTQPPASPAVEPGPPETLLSPLLPSAEPNTSWMQPPASPAAEPGPPETLPSPSPPPTEPNTSWTQPPASPAAEPGPPEILPSPSPPPTEPNTSWMQPPASPAAEPGPAEPRVAEASPSPSSPASSASARPRKPPPLMG